MILYEIPDSSIKTPLYVQAFGNGSPLLWRGCSRMPCGFVRPHVVSCDSMVYVGGGSTGKVETSRTVYKYSTTDNAWSSLPIAPYYTFALAVVKGCVTGKSSWWWVVYTS